MAATPEKITLQLRKMQEVDLSEIAQIEQSGFPDPWPEKSFQDCLHLGYYCSVLEQNFVIQAYGIMVVETGDAHILNLCVRSELRRKGRGRIMMDHLIDLARAGGANTMFSGSEIFQPACHPALRIDGFLPNRCSQRILSWL